MRKFDRLRKTVSILLAVLFIISLTVTSASAGMLDPQPEPPAPPILKLPGWLTNPWNPGTGFVTHAVDLGNLR